MKDFTRGALLALATLFSLAWAQQEVQDSAFVRVAHLSPNAEQISINLTSTEEGGQQLSLEQLSSLSYRDTTDYLQVPAGEYDVAVETPQGTLQETLSFDSGVYYTVAATGLVIPENLGQEGAQQEEEDGFFSFLSNVFGGGEEDSDALELRLASYEDEFVTATTAQPITPGVTPGAPATPVQPGAATGGAAVGQAEAVQTARVRLVHAAPGTAPVSLVSAGGQNQEENVLVSDLPFAEASSYSDLNPADARNFEVRLEGSEAIALSLGDFSLEPGNIYTLFVIGTPTEEAPLEVLPLSSQPSPQGATPIGVGAMTGGAMSDGAGQQAGPQATVQLQDTQGNIVGNASFTSTQDGVQVQVQLTNFPEASQGEHGIHIHQVGQCEPPFESAGDHFNPTGMEHGFLSPGEPHAGDLPNIQLDGGGNASYTVTTSLVTLGQGQRSLNDEDGSALIIHSNPDDYITNPSGDSGSRIACGVITQSQGGGQ